LSIFIDQVYDKTLNYDSKRCPPSAANNIFVFRNAERRTDSDDPWYIDRSSAIPDPADAHGQCARRLLTSSLRILGPRPPESVPSGLKVLSTIPENFTGRADIYHRHLAPANINDLFPSIKRQTF